MVTSLREEIKETYQYEGDHIRHSQIKRQTLEMLDKCLSRVKQRIQLCDDRSGVEGSDCKNCGMNHTITEELMLKILREELG